MGQQQLLVLGIVIVGLAVVVGIRAFSENQGGSKQDAMLTDLTRLSSDAYAWYLKPATMGGGSANPAGISMAALGFDTNADGNYETANALYNVEYNSVDEAFDIGACDELTGLWTGMFVYIADGSVEHMGWGTQPDCTSF
ncbi:MAG: hypothetical protein AAGI52_00245 [Bacteroidota bacterium]